MGVHGEDTALHRRSASDVSTTSGRNAEGTFSDVWRTIKVGRAGRPARDTAAPWRRSDPLFALVSCGVMRGILMKKKNGEAGEQRRSDEQVTALGVKPFSPQGPHENGEPPSRPPASRRPPPAADPCPPPQFSNLSVDTFYESFMCADSLHRKRGFWLAYFCSMLTTWLLLCTFTDPGLALTWLNIVHALCTFPAFHVFKIQRFDKQNIYDGEAEPQTYWEQIDNGKQWTKTRKVRTARPPTRGDGITPPEVEIPLTPHHPRNSLLPAKALLVAPVVLYLLATNSTDFERQPLLINLLAMLASVVPKLRAQ